MIQVLLLILKIIGIALLVLLGLVLFIVLVVLFVPIRYRARIIYKPEHLEVTGRVSFLFSLVCVTVRYFEKLTYQGRLFGIVFLDSEKEKKEKKPKSPKKQKKTKKQSKKEEKRIGQEEPQLSEENEQPKPIEQPIEEIEEIEEPSLEEVLKEIEIEETIETEETISEAKPSFFEKLRLKFRQTRDTIDTIIGKIKKIWHQKEEAQRILEKPETKQAISFAWSKIIKMLRHILPRNLKGYLIFGSGDPATTGKVLAVLGIVYAKTGPLIDITPNFEEKQLECDLEIRGKIQIIVLVVIALQVILNKEIRQLIQDVKKLKNVE